MVGCTINKDLYWGWGGGRHINVALTYKNMHVKINLCPEIFSLA